MDQFSDESSDPETPDGLKLGAKRLEEMRAVDIMSILHEKVAFLSGGRDLKGTPIITFPANPKREKLRHQDYRPLLDYLTSVPSEETRELGFTVLIDMRGSTWTSIKPILKELHESFSNIVNIVYIIKPDNFWQKQRTSIGSQKYKFETSLVSVENLRKAIDVKQLTAEFDGDLAYDHNTWIELRLSIEDFLWQANEIIDQLEDVQEELQQMSFADDVTGARHAIEHHKELYHKVNDGFIRDLDINAQRILHRLSTSEESGYDSEYSSRNSSASLVTKNPDVQSSVPLILNKIDSVRSSQQKTEQLWQHKKTCLEQCFQLRVFEQDAEKMFDWLYHTKEKFLSSYIDIGLSYQSSKELQDDHSQFSAACQVWKDFATALDERSSVLSISVLFHQQAEQYIENVHGWAEACKLSALSSDIPLLESSIHHHQSLYETMCQAYAQVHSTSKKLLYQLDHLVQLCCQLRKDTPLRDKQKLRGKPSAYTVTPDGKVTFRGGQQHYIQGQSSSSLGGNPAADYSKGASHVLAVIREILDHHRAVEQRWSSKKVKLHQRLALKLFQEDVKQVLDWLHTHGEAFLHKNQGIGRSLAKARMYQKSHEHFENVAQNTYTNAEKLLQAAEELAQTGECNPDEIYSVAQQLGSYIGSFANRVQQRNRILNMAVQFYTHERELITWMDQLSSELENEKKHDYIDTVEGVERLIFQVKSQSGNTEDAFLSTTQEGEALLDELRCIGIMPGSACSSIEGVEEALERLSKKRSHLDQLWSNQKTSLDHLLKLRVFQKETVEFLDQLEICLEELQNFEFGRDLNEAEQMFALHNDSVSHMHNTLFHLLQSGQDILELSKNSGNGEKASEGSENDKVSVLLECLHEREVELEELAELKRVKLEQCVHLFQFENKANQVINWIRNEEAVLTKSFAVPLSLNEATSLSLSHKQFQDDIQKTHTAFVQIRQWSLQLLRSDHYSPEQIVEIEANVTKRWEKLVTCAEDRYKLVQSSMSFYKTAEQVCSVLESLEHDYLRDEDWCQRELSQMVQSGSDLAQYNKKLPEEGSYNNISVNDKASLFSYMLDKHQKQKEGFLRACTLARRTAETFLKYANRCHAYYNIKNESQYRGPDSKVKEILNNLMKQENSVLEYWTQKKKKLEEQHSFALFENSTIQTLEWISSTGEKYLSSHVNVGGTKEETEALLVEHNQFKNSANDIKEKVKLLLNLADSLIEKGHIYSDSIRVSANKVDLAYKSFSSRMDKYRCKLESRLGIVNEDKKASLSLDRNSDPSLESKLKTDVVSGALADEKRRSIRKKELIMRELLQTERVYVKDLDVCVKTYLYETRQPSAAAFLQGRVNSIFCNIEAILKFHQSTFLQELEKYESMPEDVGHCFVTWAPQFDIYVNYCKAQPESNKILVTHGGSFYEEIQKKYGVEHPIPAYLIKPVQRITKYQLLLKELLSCCEESQGEIKDGLELMQNVPKKANDALHLSMLEGCDFPIESLGEVILQDGFQVFDSRQIIRKVRDRHVFLFDLYLLFSKEVKDPSGGKSRYQYKQRLVTSELVITEHIEGDECKFGVSVARVSDSKGKNSSFVYVQDDWSAQTKDELSIQKGQIVEVLETKKRQSTSSTEWSLVCLENDPSSQGLVPSSVLAQNASKKFETPAGNSTGAEGACPTGGRASPVAKRKGFSGRKWLLPPLRKLSQNRLPQPPADVGEEAATRFAKRFEKPTRIPIPASPDMGNKVASSPAGPEEECEEAIRGDPLSISKGEKLPPDLPVEVGDEAEMEVEMPPPMRVIDEPIVASQDAASRSDMVVKTLPRSCAAMMQGATENSSTSAALANEIEKIVKERMELHSEGKDDLMSPDDEDLRFDDSASVSASSSRVTSPTTSKTSVEIGATGTELTRKEKEIRKRKFVIHELYDSEKVYVQDLADIVEGYMAEMKLEETQAKMPEGLRDGKEKIVFGNVEAIYEWHRDFFSKNIQQCVDKPEDIGRVFQQGEKRLQMYVKYCQNKPKSEYIVTEYLDFFEDVRQKLGHKLRLPDLLIKPVQRLMKYQLLLRDILKHTERAGLVDEIQTIKKAVNIMIVVPKAADDMMNIGRLQGFDVNKMTLEERSDDGDSLKFILRSSDPRKPNLAYVCQGANPDDRNQWVSNIKHLLQTQRDFLKAIQSPIAYQKEKTKNF